jgi:hypothetical protein
MGRRHRRELGRSEVTERTLTTDLMHYLTIRYPRAAILKHSDRFTSGIPDLTISVKGHTTWFEIKYVRKGSSLEKELQPLQKFTCRQLWTATERCWIVAYFEATRSIGIFAPHNLDEARLTAVGYDHTLVRQVIEA